MVLSPLREIAIGDGVDATRTGLLYRPPGPIRGSLIALPSTGHTAEKWAKNEVYRFGTLANRCLCVLFLNPSRRPEDGVVQWGLDLGDPRSKQDSAYIHRGRVLLAPDGPVFVFGNSAGGMKAQQLMVKDKVGEQFAGYGIGAAYLPVGWLNLMARPAPALFVHGVLDKTFGNDGDPTNLEFDATVDAIGEVNNNWVTPTIAHHPITRTAAGLHFGAGTTLPRARKLATACEHFPILRRADSSTPTAGLRTATGHAWHACAELTAHDVMVWWAEQCGLLPPETV